MKKSNSSKKVIFFALGANVFIAVIKYIIAFITMSTAMLAEAVHSTADSFNQVFLLVGISKGNRKPDDLHPFGFSSELYFWSFIVAVILFSIGAVFSVYQGINKLMNPEPVNSINLAFLVLGVSFLAEGFAFCKAFKKINREKGDISVFRFLRKTKKSELIVVFLEDLAALTGLATAIIMLLLEHITGILVFDGIASIIIGLILAFVAVFMGNEIRSLLIGESADPVIIKGISAMVRKEESIDRLIQIKSLQLGPDDLLVSIKVEFNHRLKSVEVSNLINGIEKDIRAKYPEVKKIFIEPDIYKKL